jgi:hypothetical protein
MCGLRMKHIVGAGPSVEQSTAETLDFDMCLTSIICEGGQRWRNRVIMWLFRIIYNCRFPASEKKTLYVPAFYFWCTKLGARRSYLAEVPSLKSNFPCSRKFCSIPIWGG